LQHLDLQRNKLNGKFPVVNFPELKNLDISCNELKDLSGLSDSCLSSLFVLKVGVNMLEELPVLDCPQLHTYFFTMNRIASLDNLCRSKLPNAKIIHGCKNRLTGALPQLSFSHLTELWLVDNFIDNIDSLANTNLAHFETLKICSNRITGKLPILNMPNLINVQL
jgi:Leucine-rich repeat (LRR) protein